MQQKFRPQPGQKLGIKILACEFLQQCSQLRILRYLRDELLQFGTCSDFLDDPKVTFDPPRDSFRHKIGRKSIALLGATQQQAIGVVHRVQIASVGE